MPFLKIFFKAVYGPIVTCGASLDTQKSPFKPRFGCSVFQRNRNTSVSRGD